MASTGIHAPKQIANQQASALRANNTITALVVHTVDADGNYVSPGAGSTQLSVREILTSSGASVMDSTNNSIGVTIRAGSAAGTEYTDGDVDATVSGGALLFDNSSNTLRSVRIDRGLPVNVVAGTISASTQVTIGNILDTSGTKIIDSTQHALIVTNVAGSAIAVNVTSAIAAGTNQIGRVAQGVGNSSGGDAWSFATVDSSNAIVKPGDGANNAVRVNVVAGAAGGSTQVSVKEILTSSGGSVMDGTNVAIRVNVVAGSAAGSTEVTVRQSSYADFNTLSRLADRDQSTQVAAILGSAPASTSYGLVTRDLSTGPYAVSSVGGVVTVSTGPSLARLVDRDASTQVAAILGAAPASTTYGLVTRDLSTGPFAVSSVGGVVTVSTGPFQISSVGGSLNIRALSFLTDAVSAVVSTGSLRVNQSSAADLLVTIYPQSSVAPSSGSSGVVVRQVIDNLITTASTNAFGGGSGSTTFAIQSSGASLRSYVTGYSITSTVQTPTVVCFRSSGTLLAPIVMAAISSAVTGANLAVAPPGYLFRTIGASDALSLNTNGSSVSGFRVWVSYFRAP
jgi:hypothetical protein